MNTLFLLGIGLFSSSFKLIDSNTTSTNQVMETISYEEQLQVFQSLGYTFHEGVTKDLILRDIFEMTWEDDTEKYIEEHPFAVLYYTFGWRSPEVPQYNYSENCIWFDLEFFDSAAQYKWFMERMGAITDGAITFTDIRVSTDEEQWEWIEFNVNGVSKKWKLAKTGYITNHFIPQFTTLTDELKTTGKYTYFDDGGQQFVIDYATPSEQQAFKQKTGLNRAWLKEVKVFE